VELTLLMRKGSELTSSDFAPAFVVVALISASSAIVFALMPSDAGHQVSGRRAKEISSQKEVDKAAHKTAIEETDDNRDQRLG
jgi:Cu/Ag efflux protein CusF